MRGTISFIGTQMQLVNCGEYLFRNKTDNNILIIATVSTKRKKQLLNFLEHDCYKNLFAEIQCISLENNRFLNFFLTFWNLLRIYYYVSKYPVDKLLIGYYKQFYGRFAYYILKKKNIKAEIIALDDGSASIVIGSKRVEEINSKIPFSFAPNRIIKWANERNADLIPDKVTFFSIYNIECSHNDQLINYKYDYLKNNINCFDIPEIILSTNLVILGEPLYFKNYISAEKYRWLLNKFAKTYDKRPILYYAHPEESYEKWKRLELENDFLYVENKLSFEIFSLYLPKNSRVVSFTSSVLVNLRTINSSLIGESIYISPSDLINKSQIKDLEDCFQSFKENGIKILNYY